MKNKKKGYTLVELIVVLAILAILAAMLVPALTGYIDKANKEKIVAETRQVVMAAQTTASEMFADNKTDSEIKAELESELADNDALILAEVKGSLSEVTVTKGSVVTLKYTAKNGKTCVYTANPTDDQEMYFAS